jgi:putative membrane protein
MKPVTSLFAFFAALCVAGGAAAQGGQYGGTANKPAAGQQSTMPERAQPMVPKGDADFLKEAAQAGMTEIEASKLAQTKATQADVKSFASKMIEEHAKAAENLKQLAAQKKVELPDKPSLMQRARLKMLAGADGEKFDQRYAESFGVKAHQKTVDLFKDAAAEAKDADVKAFAQKTLPTLQEHLTMAKAMEASVEPTAAGKPAERGAERSAMSKEKSDMPKDKGEKKY